MSFRGRCRAEVTKSYWAGHHRVAHLLLHSARVSAVPLQAACCSRYTCLLTSKMQAARCGTLPPRCAESLHTRPLSDKDMLEDLQLGLAYFTGRDKASLVGVLQ